MIKVNDKSLIETIDYSTYRQKVEEIDKGIREKTVLGNNFLGWVDYPLNYDKEEFERIKIAAKDIRENYDVMLVCGIGGSYLGARAAIEAINGLIQDKGPEIIYFGQTLAPSYVSQVLEHIKGKRFAINVISKSGTTTETAIAFRLARELLESQVGKEEAAKAIFATTDAHNGALLKLCEKYGYQRFVLPADIGGRYSVFTAVGLLPMAVAGLDIDAFLEGARQARSDFDKDLIEAYKYALIRHHLYKNGKGVEMLCFYEPRFVQLGEWWKQLYGESEGKNKSGLLPDAATFTTDLHSLGQFIQDGSPLLFETIVNIVSSSKDVLIPHDEDDLDGLNYLEGKGLDYVNKKAMDGTMAAHSQEGNVPNIVLEVERMDEYALGYLMYFFCRNCAMSATLNGVNPFNQPGVEVYKKNMFRLLGKPGSK